MGSLSERTLDWDGCLNVRDLGGLPTSGGGTTRYGALLRSDNLERLTPAGWSALGSYGVKTIVDLRFADETSTYAPPAARRPSTAYVPPADVVTVQVSVLGDHDPALDVHLDRISAAHTDEVASTRATYVDMLERFQTRFAEAVVAVARAEEGAVLIHCHAGKDRTGLVVALLLAVAGVPDEVIAADYALSAANLEPLSLAWIHEADDVELREFRRRVCSSPAQAMIEVLAELGARPGGVCGYLTDGGLDEADLARVRALLVS